MSSESSSRAYGFHSPDPLDGDDFEEIALDDNMKRDSTTRNERSRKFFKSQTNLGDRVQPNKSTGGSRPPNRRQASGTGIRQAPQKWTHRRTSSDFDRDNESDGDIPGGFTVTDVPIAGTRRASNIEYSHRSSLENRIKKLSITQDGMKSYSFKLI